MSRQDLITVQIDRARQALALAKDAPAAKQVADIAHAAEVYARRQKLGEEAIGYAFAVKIDALTLLGGFLKKADKQAGGRGRLPPGPGRGKKNRGTKMEPLLSPKLSDLGIGKKESSQSQKLFEIKSHRVSLHNDVRERRRTVGQVIKLIRDETKRTDLETKARAANVGRGSKAKADWQIIRGDCRAHLGIKDKARLIFADPPYNIGVDYGDGADADKLSHEEFIQFCSEWIAVCHARLTDDGSLWVLIGDEYAAEMGCLLRQHEFHRRAWIKWYETFGVNQANNFNRCSRHLFYCVKNQRQFVFNADAVNRPSDRQTKYNDARANPAGKIWDDVWQIPRLVGTAKERIPDFPTQLPLDLLRPIIGCASDPGDLVLDPFNGSGTTGHVCIELGRRYIGIEKSERFHELAIQRLKGVRALPSV